jgi:hypothetical protein
MASSQQDERQIGKQWDELAAQVVGLFNRIQAQPVITAADAQAAGQALSQLAAAADQFSSISYITNQWTSAAYKPAFEQRLQQIFTAASSQTTSTVGAPTTAAVVGSGSSFFISPIVLIGLAVGAIWIFSSRE